MCSREMAGNKRGNRGFDNRRSCPTKSSVGVGLGRDSEIAPTGVGFHGISMGFTIAFLNQSVDRSLFSRLIVSPLKRLDSEGSGFCGELDLGALLLRREVNGKANLCGWERLFYIAGSPRAATHGVD